MAAAGRAVRFHSLGARVSIPDYQSCMRPLLAYAADGSEKGIRPAFDELAKEFGLTPEERTQLLPSGKQSLFENRVHWARTYLDKAGAIRRTRRAHFQITERGRELLASNPKKITTQDLKKFSEFQEFQSIKKDNGEILAPAGEPKEYAADSSQTPEEAIVEAQQKIEDSLRDELLTRISELNPAFFEQLVVDLIVAMGYGGSKSIVAKRIGQSGDEGIDGVVNEDPLGLDVVYIQAKRYAEGNNVGRERIQQFIGALIGQGAHRGVFFTTSTFTKNAQEYAQKVPQRVILIDGAELTRLMLQYGIGVRNERTIELRRVDEAYFSTPLDA
jgi:restriction system protein